MVTLQVTKTKDTIILIQSVEYLPTRHLLELGIRDGKAFNVERKVAVI